MKKRVFAVMAAVLFMGSTMSMAEELEDDSPYTECLASARSLVISSAEDNGHNPNDHQIYMTVYLNLAHNCAQQYGLIP